MKKLILPIAVIAASGTYVWLQQGQLPAEAGLAATAEVSTAGASTPDASAASMAPAAQAQPSALPAQIAVPATLQRRGESDDDQDDEIPLPIRRPAPTLPVGIVQAAVPAPTDQSAPLVVAAQLNAGAFKDGTFTGSQANAYYGLVQVAAVVQGGQLTSVKILQYPSDRRTSRYINSQALPLLIREAIQAQSGNVDFISGATLTSNAFAKSLGSALAKASR